MRKVLLWGRMTPCDELPAVEILLRNLIASNTGNLLFTYSAARAVMTEGTQLIPFYSEDVDRLLSEPGALEGVDCAVIPLANAFRRDFIPKLARLTRFLRAAKFPCYIVGVGMQAASREQLAQGFPFDEQVRDFMRAALEKSARVGVRGAYTAEYLKGLGFGEGAVRVIGCPAAFARGPQPRAMRALPPEKLRRAAVSARPGLPDAAAELIGRGVAGFSEVHFVEQDLYGLWAIYFGHRRSRRTRAKTAAFYPLSPADAAWREGRLHAFLRATDWLAFMEGFDLAFGSRIHGNMAAALAGRPCILVASDLRVQELAEYHALPCVRPGEVAPGADFREVYALQDFGAFERLYPEKFTNFVDFLDENGLPHIYAAGGPAEGEAPLDRAMARLSPLPELRSGMRAPLRDRLRILEMYKKQLEYKRQSRRLPD